MARRKRRRDGFTLIELLVVVVIISMLATLLAPRVFKGLGKAKADIARANMTVIEDSLVRFQYNCGRFPTDADGGLVALLEAPPDLEDKWAGPYLKRSQLIDPWDQPYLYYSEGQYNPGSFDLVSLGADGTEGGEGDNADIIND